MLWCTFIFPVWSANSPQHSPSSTILGGCFKVIWFHLRRRTCLLKCRININRLWRRVVWACHPGGVAAWGWYFRLVDMFGQHCHGHCWGYWWPGDGLCFCVCVFIYLFFSASPLRSLSLCHFKTLEFIFLLSHINNLRWIVWIQKKGWFLKFLYLKLTRE